jgi:hypothetical protein
MKQNYDNRDLSERGTGSTVNKEYKSDVFKMYFSIRKNALELYNALNGTTYTNEEDLVIDTLDNAFFMKIYNDVSFMITGTVNLYEHQSTVNPNMPLRDLFYIADVYKRYAMKADLYGRTLIKVPTPKFVVFYNGTTEIPDKETLKLSDSFLHETKQYEARPHSTGQKEAILPELELTVQVLNVNYGHNRELMEKCVALRDYAILVERVRENLRMGYSIEEAATKAVDSCIAEHVMEDFLIKEKAGVIKMHVLDFDEEKHNESLRQEGREDGIREGIEKGIKESRTRIVNNMLQKGKNAEEIAELCDIPLTVVIEIQNEIKTPV